ncbi:LysR family transcriptional regulator [Francisella sp. 19X1-34]|uniref:LysR family transcriptional regulator n=1 Tax=Francisella sp. 19X1-34 TaxID=3087177 RepID=UPI002E310D57|nr:LysR family transcriptional regulator [Francisella sp. 19X1-34]MED7787856.1 LysR family transcriptional regulator [Francisella sp. 19X1-34]
MSYTLHQLRVFISIVENKSVRKAAENLFLTPPAVTKQLQNLEDIIEIELFERKNNSLRLNRKGKCFYDLIKSIVDRVDEVNKLELPLLRSKKSNIKIGMSPIFEQSVFDGINKCIDQGFSFEYDLKVYEKPRLIEMLESYSIDVILAVISDDEVQDLKNKGFNVRLYHRIDFDMYASKKLLKRYGNLDTVFRESALILESKQRNKFGLSNIISFDCCLSVYNAILQGVGYGFLPTFPLKPGENEDLVCIDKGVSLGSSYSYFVYRTKEQDKLNIINELFN